MAGFAGTGKGSEAAEGHGQHGLHLGALVAGFARSPLAVASPFPSSEGMARQLLAPVRWQDVAGVVELGPGSGAITWQLLRRMRRDARLIAIDTDPDLIDYLGATIADPRLSAVTGSALNIAELLHRHGMERVDCIVSGIPFSALSEAEGLSVAGQGAMLLGPSGLFLAYQMRRTIEGSLKRVFATVERRRYWLNLPPCHLYTATGRLAGGAEEKIRAR